MKSTLICASLITSAAAFAPLQRHVAFVIAHLLLDPLWRLDWHHWILDRRKAGACFRRPSLQLIPLTEGAQLGDVVVVIAPTGQ